MYKITNNINGKFYVGVHKTKKVNDEYFGSGKYLNRAINKYGIKNFRKEIIEYFNDTKEMFAKEKEIVDEEFVKRTDTYNLKIGGFGGFDYVNKVTSREQKSKAGKKSVWVQKQRGTRKEGFTKEEQEKAHKAWRYYYDNDLEFRKKHNDDLRKAGKLANTPEAMKKRRETFKEVKHQQGERNSQYGTMWITNNLSNRKIKKDEQIPLGWKKGRNI